MAKKIDFVITWVDETDPKWRREFEYHSAKEGRCVNTSPERYRDWGTLKYWFRGVEKFASWVNKIYFVTYGHLPEWLDTSNPKLVIVKHEDFIPEEYLPTFSSDCIEFFLHKINGLSDHFVYFNDDTFIINTVTPDRFFKNGLPCDCGILSIITIKGLFGCCVYRALDLIRANFNKKDVVSKNRSKWYSLKYPRLSLHNLLMYRQPVFTGFINHHLPQGYLKETYEDVWSHCEEDLKHSCYNRFRTYGNIAHWLIRYWQLASGNFSPYNVFKDGKCFHLQEKNIQESIDCISRQQKKMVCLNDCEKVLNYKDYQQKIVGAFERILPNKCSFEL